MPWVVDGHRIFRIVLVVQWLLSIVIGLITGEIMVAFLLGIPILAVPLALSFQDETSRLSRVAIGIGTQLMTALHIHQAFGLIEMHFEIFVILAFLAYFRDWIVIAAATAVVAVHHIGFFLLQVNGAPVYVFEADHVTFSILLLHAAFALAEGIMLMFMASKAEREGIGAASLNRAIAKMTADTNSLDLSVALDKQYEIVQSFDRLLAPLKELLANNANVVASITASTTHIGEVSNQLAHHAEENNTEVDQISSAAVEIAATMHESTAQIHVTKEATAAATQASQHSRAAIDDANRQIASLREQLQKASSTNSALNSSISEIANAMQSITSVAEQTNLLALNAAIESARAGEHGRGFAVVADEVRTLAIRSKESADMITKITEQLVNETATSVAQIEQCVKLVDEAVAVAAGANQHMQTIDDNIHITNKGMEETAQGALEQETASQSIAEGTTRVRDLVNAGAKMAQQLDGDVHELSQNCAALERSIARFKL